MDSLQTLHRLMAGLRTGDARSGQLFWEQYGPILQRLANNHMASWLRRRVEPEDVVQSICRTFFRHLQQGDYQLSGKEDLFSLLCAITLNKVLMKGRFHQAQRRDLHKETSFHAFAENSDVMPVQLMADEPSSPDATEFAEQFEEQLARLNEEERRIIDLELQGYTQTEIAERLKRTDRWVRKVLERVRKRLRDALSESAL